MSTKKDKAERIERKKEALLSAVGFDLVKFTRPFEAGSFMGYVLDVGPKFFLLVEVSDEIYFNGFRCIRIQDVRNLKFQASDARFPKLALERRGLRRPPKPDVDLSSTQLMLQSAGRAFTAIAIFRETINHELLHIGHVLDVTEKRISLLEIDPDADWDDKPTEYKISEITQVSMGGGYEDALALAGGLPPPVAS